MFLSNFQKIRPKFEVPQKQLLEWLAMAHFESRRLTKDGEAQFSQMQKFVSRFACRPEQISSRGIQLADAFETDYQKMQVYQISEKRPQGLGMLERSEFFSENCKEIFEKFYPTPEAPPNHIIHVTCTGYVSPSGAQALVAKRNWNSQTAVTHAYHMGCYASLPAVRIAEALAQNSVAKVDIVHTEMCSLHLNPANHSPEQIVVQSLFADGFIKYSVSALNEDDHGFEILKIKEFIIPESEKMMSWMTSDFGMQMTLAKEVPSAIALHLKNFLESFALNDRVIYAIHPGGPKIIELIQDLLKLSPEQIQHSKNVLFHYGNMSSASLPHIWQDLLEDEKIASGTLVMSLAFGPGLSIFGSLLRKI